MIPTKARFLIALLVGSFAAEAPSQELTFNDLARFVAGKPVSVTSPLNQLMGFGSVRKHYAETAALAEKCPKLATLIVDDCGLTALPENIGKLTKLETLDATNNELRELPRSITNLTDCYVLLLEGNPLERPPLEVAKYGIRWIREYFIHY